MLGLIWTPLRAILITTLCLWLWAKLLPTISYPDVVTLVLMATVFVVIDAGLKPIAKLLLLPLNIATLGLAYVFLNAAVLWLSTYLVPGFEILPMTVLGIKLDYWWSLLLFTSCFRFTLGVIKWVSGFFLP